MGTRVGYSCVSHDLFASAVEPRKSPSSVEEEIEVEEDQVFGPTFEESRLERGESGAPWLSSATISPSMIATCCRLGDGAELRRPVQAFAGFQGDVFTRDSQLSAIAIELDLMHPASTGRRPLENLAKLRSDEMEEIRGRIRARPSSHRLCPSNWRRFARSIFGRKAVAAVPPRVRIRRA
jgi:hypothetical protein